jgi:hypothetical protein
VRPSFAANVWQRLLVAIPIGIIYLKAKTKKSQWQNAIEIFLVNKCKLDER